MLEVTPKVSIGMPLYNAERYLDEAVESLLAQSFRDFELIMCDNASTDETLERCRYWANRDERIVVLESEINRGAAWNYNRAVEAASGKYFRWHAHDDRCDSVLLERLVGCFEAEPKISLAYPYSEIIDEHGNHVRMVVDELGVESVWPFQRGRMLLRNLHLCNAVFGLVETEVLRSTSMIGAYFGSDRVLLFELALRGPYAVVPEHLFQRRLHSESSLKANQSKQSIESWFDTSAKNRFRSAGVELFRQHLAAAVRTPMSFKNRALTVLMVSVEWPVAHARFLKRRRQRRQRLTPGPS